MRSLVAHICNVTVEVIGELVFDGQVPLLRVGEMPFVELPVTPGYFPLSYDKSKNGGAWYCAPVKPLLNSVAGVMPPSLALRMTFVLNPSRPPATPEFHPG